MCACLFLLLLSFLILSDSQCAAAIRLHSEIDPSIRPSIHRPVSFFSFLVFTLLLVWMWSTSWWRCTAAVATNWRVSSLLGPLLIVPTHRYAYWLFHTVGDGSNCRRRRRPSTSPIWKRNEAKVCPFEWNGIETSFSFSPFKLNNLISHVQLLLLLLLLLDSVKWCHQSPTRCCRPVFNCLCAVASLLFIPLLLLRVVLQWNTNKTGNVFVGGSDDE